MTSALLNFVPKSSKGREKEKRERERERKKERKRTLVVKLGREM